MLLPALGAIVLLLGSALIRGEVLQLDMPCLVDIPGRPALF